MTDKLRSYGAALKTAAPHRTRQSRYLNNRAENSHHGHGDENGASALQVSRHAQRFLSVFEPLNTHFRPPAFA
jgi:transposase-like protein